MFEFVTTVRIYLMGEMTEDATVVFGFLASFSFILPNTHGHGHHANLVVFPVCVGIFRMTQGAKKSCAVTRIRD